MLVEALVAKLAVEAFDVAVLHRTTRFDEQVFDAVLLRPCHEGTAGELRPIVSAHCFGVTAKARRLVQDARHVNPTHAVVHRDIDALVSEVIGNGQALQASAARQRIRDKVHAPHLVARSVTAGAPRWAV